MQKLVEVKIKRFIFRRSFRFIINDFLYNCRNTRNKRVFRNVFCYNSTGSNNRTFSDGHSRVDKCPAADPDIIADGSHPCHTHSRCSGCPDAGDVRRCKLPHWVPAYSCHQW